MAETPTTSTQAEPGHPTEQQEPQESAAVWHRLALGGVLLIAVFMNIYRLGQNGFDSYYPPAVRSMMDNWHNFFFAAYDPGGFTSLDKPPVGFWFQVLSAKIFGFTPFSVLLPQALAGVLSVLLLYSLVRRHFGETAGLLAALTLALSPISVVTNRNVTIDSTLALTMLMGAWAVLRAAETGRLRWLLLCAAIVGVGFNIKMLEAYLVVPAYGLLYLLAAPRSIWTRVGHLALASILLLVVSFSWALAVDLTPATLRPHVGSTQDNSEISLALGYNGLQRLLGLGGGGLINPPQPSGSQSASSNGNAGLTPTGNYVITTGKGSWNIGPGNDVPALFHLFTEPLAGQSGWLLPLAIFGMIALVQFRRPRPQSDRTLQALILWGMWLLTMGIFFSVAGFIHEYYLTVMAPALAALCGIGLVTMWQDYRRSPHDKSGGYKRAWLLPLALIATAAEQVFILTGYPDWGRWMIPLLIVLCLLAVGVLIGARLPWRFTRNERMTRLLMPALAFGLVALMIGPTLWAAIPIFQGTESDLPLAGPSFGRDGPRGGFQPMMQTGNTKLIRYLVANQGNAQILVAVAGMVDEIILATNKPVIPLEGFSSYPLTTTELASLVSQGKLRFLLLNEPQDPAQGSEQGKGLRRIGGRQGDQQLDSITTWVKQRCKVVPSSEWQSSSANPSNGNGPGPNGMKLYDCATAH